MSTGVIAVRYGVRCAKCAIGLDCSAREGSTHARCANVQLAQSGWWTMLQGTLFACASCRCGRPCHCRSHVLDYCRHCGHHGSICCCHFSSVKPTATATTHHRTPAKLSILEGDWGGVGGRFRGLFNAACIIDLRIQHATYF